MTNLIRKIKISYLIPLEFTPEEKSLIEYITETLYNLTSTEDPDIYINKDNKKIVVRNHLDFILIDYNLLWSKIPSDTRDIKLVLCYFLNKMIFCSSEITDYSRITIHELNF